MNVFAVTGSPKADKGNTEKLLRPFLEGMSRAGAAIERVYVARLDIKPCSGEFICWDKKPGTCHLQDDMQDLYPKIKMADILVLATPVYIPLPGEMQNFVNRLTPLINPFLSWREGRTRAELRSDVQIKKIVLVATSGWWEMGNFGTVVRIAEELAKDVSAEFAGALLRPHFEAAIANKKVAGEMVKAAEKAGFDLVSKGKLDRGTLKTISQPSLPVEEYRRRSNKFLEEQAG